MSSDSSNNGSLSDTLVQAQVLMSKARASPLCAAVKKVIGSFVSYNLFWSLDEKVPT